MEAQAKIDVKDLETRIGQLQKNLSFIGQSPTTSASELFQIIHRPGWTTPVQVTLAGQILEGMTQQAAAIRSLRDTLNSHVTASGGK